MGDVLNLLYDTKRLFHIVRFMVICSLWVMGTRTLGQEVKHSKIEDSLNQVSHDSVKINILFRAAENSVKDQPEKAKEYVARLVKYPQILGDSVQLVSAQRIKAHADRVLGNYVQSIGQFEICYAFYKRKKDSVNLAFVANQLGSMNIFMGYHEKAQNYLQEVHRIHTSLKDSAKMASSINGLAIFHSNIGNQDKAIATYYEALDIYQKVKDTMGQANVHANLGLTFIERKEFDKAERHIQQQGHLDSLLQTQFGLGFYHDFMGYLRQEQGRLTEALQFYKTSLGIRLDLPSHYNIAETRLGLAGTYLKLERFKLAIEHAEKVFDGAEKRQSLHQQRTAYSILSDSYEKMNRPTLALQYQKLLKKISDSIYNGQLLDKITEKDAKFERALQENKIELLNMENRAKQQVIRQKNKILTLGTLLLLLISALCLGLYLITKKYFKQKELATTALAQKEILIKEIHHRVKNNLQLISSMLTLQGNSIDNELVLQAIKEGKSRVRSMALIHQDLYQHDHLTSVNTPAYLNKLADELFETYNISKENIVLHKNIESIYLDVDSLVPIGLIINELISNALKYAFVGRTNGTIWIGLEQIGALLRLTVQDDGVGYDPSTVKKSTFGSKLVESLAAQLDATVKITMDQGTKIQLEIKSFKVEKNGQDSHS